MGIYKKLKLIITHYNEQYKNSEITAEEYKSFKTDTLEKMDTFILCNRFSSEKYKELFDMFITFEDEEESI